MANYFGTDGVRGKANHKLTGELAFQIGKAAALVLTKKQRQAGKRPVIIIGKDTRISGDMLEAALAAGVTAAGADALLLGVIPTPGVAILCRQLQAAAGAVISASHNHFADNGIKFFAGDGYKLPDSVQAEIEFRLDHPDLIPLPEGEQLGRISLYPNAAAEYAAELLRQQSPDLSGLKIVVDAANGAASAIAAPLFRQLGAEVISLFDQPDGCNINEACGSTHLAALQSRVLAEQADLGLALDGDADRLLAIDERGQEVDGDQLLAIAARALQQAGQLQGNQLVVTVMSNMGLKLAMEKLGITVEETPVGDRHVIARMRECDANLGGEQSGHLIFSDYNSTGDGLAAAIFLLRIRKESGQSFSELTAVMEKLPMITHNLPVVDKEAWQHNPTVQKTIQRAEAALAGQGRILIRASGTEQLLRIMAEGRNELLLRNLVASIVEAISEETAPAAPSQLPTEKAK